MFGASYTSALMMLWAAVTVVFLVVAICKLAIGRKEVDVVVLDPAEAKQTSEQQEVIAQIKRLESWTKGLGLASLTLFLCVVGISVYRAFAQIQ